MTDRVTGLDLEAIRARAWSVRQWADLNGDVLDEWLMAEEDAAAVERALWLAPDVDALLAAVETLTRERDEVGVQADMLCAALERIARLSMASGTLASLAEARSIAAAALAGVSGGSEAAT